MKVEVEKTTNKIGLFMIHLSEWCTKILIDNNGTHTKICT